MSISERKSKKKNLIWAISRGITEKSVGLELNKIPGWTGFHSVLSAKITIPTVIGNCRSVPAPPTDKDVVYTVLCNTKKMLTELGQVPAVITCDEAIYAIAKEILWTSPKLNDVLLRMGGFHRTKNFLGVIGKRMSGCGFDDVLEESGLYGSNHIQGILKGKHYYRGVNAHKQFTEALIRLYWDAFQVNKMFFLVCRLLFQ